MQCSVAFLALVFKALQLTILQQIQYIVPPPAPRITVYESMKTENDLVKVFLQSQSRRT